MKTVSLALLSILFIVSCGEDASKNKRGAVMLKKPSFNTAESEAGIMAHIQRDSVVVPLSSAEAINDIVNNTLPKTFRVIPRLSDVEKPRYDVESIGRPAKACGSVSNASLGDRITSCEKANADLSTWSNKNGVAGESNWKLVSLADDKEIWVDLRTGMLWSDVINTQADWCSASGNNEGVCKTNSPAMICNSMVTFGNIKWRLPTRNDYLQADINGLRSVVKPSKTETAFWAATIDSSNMDRAWTYDLNRGMLGTAGLEALRQVRCIGAAAR